jgi:AcrR family transcriptional regulator
MYIGEMAASIDVPERARRTQAERRQATREALLDATIECLAEEGYAKTTTRRIAERAGVTPGALQHHFANRAELLGHARRHVGSKVAREMFEDGVADIPSIQLRTERQLDRWWDLLTGPRFAAIVELWVAARTDRELREQLAAAERDGARLAALATRIVYPELADLPGFVQLISTGQATMRGLAILRFVDEAEADKAWPAMRAQMLAQVAQFTADAGASP